MSCMDNSCNIKITKNVHIFKGTTPTTSSNNNGTSFTSPFHKRLHEFEERISRWRSRKHVFSVSKTLTLFRRSASIDPKEKESVINNRNVIIKNPNNCYTSPIPRKAMNLDFSNLSSPEKQDIISSERFNEVRKLLGIIKVGGKEYKNCSPNDLEYISDIGHGAFGRVTKERFKMTKELMAVKHMDLLGTIDEQKRVIMDCYVILSTHTHPHIVNCYGILTDAISVYICMEVMPTCIHNLIYHTVKGGLPEIYVCKFLVGILDGLYYLKTKNLMHRDVKPSNMLLNWDGIIKLCDFGVAGTLVDSKIVTSIGTGCMLYLAPERVASNPNYDSKADVWSFGISIYEMIKGETPYRDVVLPFILLNRIKNDPPPDLRSLDVTDELKEFINKCLQKDVYQRGTYVDLLNHFLIKTYREKEVDISSWLQELLIE
uniref:mitogen-activated protein kinase kinase n=1 Tax=Parastrongyloides trichosuri TaxID=131310 RepID=A0A0N4Z3L5_PARTI